MMSPILFRDEMVLAILEGRKTQTRRLIRMRDGSLCDDSDVPAHECQLADYVMDYSRTFPNWQTLECPKGNAGDRLWVRERWQGLEMGGRWWHEVKREDRSLLNWAWTNPVMPSFPVLPPRWLPSIHMPRMACRILLEIVSVRVDRVARISREDAIKEGVDKFDAVMKFSQLWNSIHAAEGTRFEDNPWVWVIEFKAVDILAKTRVKDV